MPESMTNADILAEFKSTPTPSSPITIDRATDMSLAWKAYQGQHTDPLKTKPGTPDDNVKFNGCRVIVDKGVAFLFGRGIAFDLDGDDDRSPAEEYLDTVWQANRRDELVQRLGINGGVCGQAFLKIRLEDPVPRLLPINPAQVTVETADDDCTRVLSYIIRWSGKGTQGKPVEYRQLIERKEGHWTITDQRAETTGGIFRANHLIWKTTGSEVWPWDFAPMVECQNLSAPNDYWGVPDLTSDIIHLNDAINRTLSNINRILRFHAHPKTWSKGLSETQIKQLYIDADRIIHLPGADASLQNLEMKSDLGSSIEYYHKLREAMYELSRIPEIASGKVQDLQYLSGVAMQVLYGPLIEKTLAKRLTFGGGLLADVNDRLLRIVGMPSEKQTQIQWPEVFPRDMQVESLTAINLQMLGVSRDTILTGMGYDPALEEQRRAKDQAEEVAHAQNLAEANNVQRSQVPSRTTPER